MLKITNVSIINHGINEAVATVILNRAISLKNIAIEDHQTHFTVTWPEIDGLPVFCPITIEFAESLKSEIVKEYRRHNKCSTF